MTARQPGDELPILLWLLRHHAGEVFRVIRENQPERLGEFVSWFLGAARGHAEHFSGHHEYHSFNLYVYGRPRHAEWARLAQEVQHAAIDVGIPFPESLLLPAMPTIDAPILAVSLVSPVRVTKRQWEKVQKQFFARNPKADARS